MLSRRKRVFAGLGLLLLGAAVWWFFLRDPGRAGAPDRFQVRAARRAYDGAPPVIPHPPLGGSCTNCHAEAARELPGLGVAPPNPHRHTPGLSAASRCEQCHVFRRSDDLFALSSFHGLAQSPRRGERLSAHAPPVLPHGVFMREDCNACHAGPSARAELRCSHPERGRCLQCHAQAVTRDTFGDNPSLP